MSGSPERPGIFDQAAAVREPVTGEHLGAPLVIWQAIRWSPRVFAAHAVLQVFYLSSRVLPGLIEKAVFDKLTGASPLTIGLGALIALYVSVGLARMISTYSETWAGWTFRYAVGARFRHNLFRALVRRPGAATQPVSPGEAVNRYRDDVAEIADFPTWLPDVAGNVLSFAVAVAIMAYISLPITIVVFVPLAAAFFVGRASWGRMLRYRRDASLASDAVAGFLGELFGAVQAVKVANAEHLATARFRNLGEVRRRAMLRVGFLEQFVWTFPATAVLFGVGVMLLMAGQAMVEGSFTVGDFALFTYYLWFTTDLPGYLGTFVGDYKQQEVAISRLAEMIPEEPHTLIRRQPAQPRDPAIAAQSNPEGRLETLEVRGLTCLHQNGDRRGISDVDLTLRRGSFTVITGQIGSGKSTLLRTLLGLLPRDAGRIFWNGSPVEDPSEFLQPPRCAYTAQVPRLFSASLEENILLGQPAAPADLQDAIWQAVLEEDIRTLGNGLQTVVGPRGVRLSGGQVQRAAAARMFVRQPELVVCDDLSSALDVETERALWDRTLMKRKAGQTYLVVSHRRVALQLADRIIVLKEGRVEATGTLDELLASSLEMQRLWMADSLEEHRNLG